MEVVSLGAIAIGLINVGSADAEASSTLLQRLLELTPQKLSSTYSRLKIKIYSPSMYQRNGEEAFFRPGFSLQIPAAGTGYDLYGLS